MRGILGLFCGFFYYHNIDQSHLRLHLVCQWLKKLHDAKFHASPFYSIIWILDSEEKIDQLINVSVNIHDRSNNKYKSSIMFEVLIVNFSFARIELNKYGDVARSRIFETYGIILMQYKQSAQEYQNESLFYCVLLF